MSSKKQRLDLLSRINNRSSYKGFSHTTYADQGYTSGTRFLQYGYHCVHQRGPDEVVRKVKDSLRNLGGDIVFANASTYRASSSSKSFRCNHVKGLSLSIFFRHERGSSKLVDSVISCFESRMTFKRACHDSDSTHSY